MSDTSSILSVVASILTVVSVIAPVFVTFYNKKRSLTTHPLLSWLSGFVIVFMLISHFELFSSGTLSVPLFRIVTPVGGYFEPTIGTSVVFIGIMLLYSDTVRALSYKSKRHKNGGIFYSSLLVFTLSTVSIFSTYWGSNSTFILLTSMQLVSLLTWYHTIKK